MHGNVWEWCEDWYDEEKNIKVRRGGTWIGDSYMSKSSHRGKGNTAISNRYVGFRLQRTLSS